MIKSSAAYQAAITGDARRIGVIELPAFYQDFEGRRSRNGDYASATRDVARILGEFRGKGYARALMQSCIDDARAQGRSGVCMLGADKQKAWLSDQSFAQRFGFTAVDSAPNGYQLLALSLDGSVPRFAEKAKSQRIDEQELTVYYDDQCPFIPQRVDKLRAYCEAHGIPARFIHVDTLAQAKALPCVFNNWAVLYQGRFVTVNQLDGSALEKLLRA